ncbi:hypothetical protein HK102_005906 [Quaeritorhiza haematococci]|nr:hypothetical protein HK102_005906 [Quaeritorhiza haematococci]
MAATPANLWISYRYKPVEVPTNECWDVDDLLKAIMAKSSCAYPLGLPEDHGPLCLHYHPSIAEDTDSLPSDLSLAQLCQQPGFVNSFQYPLLIRIGTAEWSVVTAPPAQTYTPELVVFELPMSYLEHTGLPARRLVLYCRSQFHQQFKFLEDVLNTRKSNNSGFREANPFTLGWITGPWGAGKSTTALAFASTLDRGKWTVTWLHLRRDEAMCVQFVGNQKRARVIKGACSHQIEDVLTDIDITEHHHIVFLDGYTLQDGQREQYMACIRWLESNYEKHRLVIICSTACRGHISETTDMKRNCKEFFLESWRLEEYLAAVRNDSFFQNVCNGILDSTGWAADSHKAQDNFSRDEIVKSKYYFAGNCPRFMFDYPTTDVVDCIQSAVALLDDIVPYVQYGKGKSSCNAVTHLFSRHLDSPHRWSKTAVISRFGASQIATKLTPSSIPVLADALFHNRSGMDEWLLEMWFVASLCNGGFTFFHDGKADAWPESRVEAVDLERIAKIPNDAVWWKPTSVWIPGGYDAVFLEKEAGLVRFVQISHDATHAFRIEHFRRLLDRLAQLMKISRLEICLLSPRSSDQVQISVVTGEGLLAEFDGWEKGKERNAIKRCFVDIVWQPK